MSIERNSFAEEIFCLGMLAPTIRLIRDTLAVKMANLVV